MKAVATRATGEPQDDATQKQMQHAQGFGIASDHMGNLTGVKGKTFHPDLRPRLLDLSIKRQQGHITPEQHAEAVKQVLGE
jgi:hypothetical protein